ncbi:unnamed protein product [Camellia sinensis]
MFRITLTKTHSFLLLHRTHPHRRPNTSGDAVSTPLQIRRRGNTLDAVTDSVYLEIRNGRNVSHTRLNTMATQFISPLFVIKSEGSWHYAPDGVDLVPKNGFAACKPRMLNLEAISLSKSFSKRTCS